jgi:hypothetical protein
VLGILGFDSLSHCGGPLWATYDCSCTNFSFLGVCMRAHNGHDCPTPKNAAIKTRNVDIPSLMLRTINPYTGVLSNVCFFAGARKTSTLELPCQIVNNIIMKPHAPACNTGRARHPMMTMKIKLLTARTHWTHLLSPQRLKRRQGYAKLSSPSDEGCC